MKTTEHHRTNPESLFSRNPKNVREAYLKTRPGKAKSLWTFLKPYISFHERSMVYSPGCSYAVYESEFQKLVNCQVIASDIDLAAIRSFQQTNILKVAADAVNPPFKGGAFDVILLPQVLEHVHDYKHCMKSLDLLLKPGGYMYIHVPNPWSIIYPPLLGQSWFKFSTRNWLEGLTYLARFYLYKLRKDYLKNRVRYHAGFTKVELLELLPRYDVKFLFWERVLSQYDNWLIRLIILVAKKQPRFVQNLLEMETYLIAQKPMYLKP